MYILKKIILILLLLPISFLVACDNPKNELNKFWDAPEKPQEHSSNDLSGTWELHSLPQDPITQQFIDLKTLINIRDNGQDVVIDDCFRKKRIHLTRANNYLTTSGGLSLRIMDGSHLNSISIPHIVKLIKRSNFKRRANGFFKLDTNNEYLANINRSEGVCVQQTVYEAENIIALQISVPYLNNYMEIDIYIDDINEESSNIDLMTFFSPAFGALSMPWMLSTLEGNVIFSELTENRINLTFDITTVENSRFPGEHFVGHLDVNF